MCLLAQGIELGYRTLQDEATPLVKRELARHRKTALPAVGGVIIGAHVILVVREAHPADEQGTPLLVHEGLAGVVVKAIVPVTEGGGVDGGVWCLGAHETPVLPHEIEDRALHGEVACGMDVLAGKPLRIVGIP